MIPFGEPFEPGERGPAAGADDGGEPDAGAMVPARPACRPECRPRRGDSGRR